MKPRLSLKILPAQPEHAVSILRFLQKYFFPDEPISVSLNRSPRTTAEVLPLRFLSQGHSYLAVNALDSEDNLVGVILNGEASAEELMLLDKLITQHEGTKFEQTLRFLRTIEHECGVWDFIKGDKAFKTFIVAVSSGYRGQRIGQHLFEHSRQRAKSCGYTHMVVDCTSHYSACVVERIGYKCIYHLPYNKYIGEDGEPIFKTRPPHTGVRVFVTSVTRIMNT